MTFLNVYRRFLLCLGHNSHLFPRMQEGMDGLLHHSPPPLVMRYQSYQRTALITGVTVPPSSALTSILTRMYKPCIGMMM